MSEQWRAVVGHPGYEVSELGNVRSVDRLVLTRNGQVRRYRGQPLTARPGKRGYRIVKHGGGTFYVHTLVLETFVGPRPVGLEGCHGNGDRTDNRLGNLSWGTRADNVADMAEHGTNPRINTEACPRSHRLLPPNLVAAKQRKGVRECLSCQRARTTVRHARDRHGIAIDFVAEADRRYALLMGAAA